MAIAEKGPSHNLAQRLTDLETAVQKLSTQDVLLNATFGPGLTVAQAYTELESQIASSTSPLVGEASNSGFTLTTSYQTLCTITMTVPTGFTRALVMATGSVNGATDSASGEILTGSVVISGTSGPESTNFLTNSQFAGVVAPAHARSLTGLGASFTITLRAHLTQGPGSGSPATPYNTSGLVAQAIFLP